ncbi:pyridoxamine 5'-phosphate oxidase [Sphingomicrobium lutaoense]|uniref:Pyridoxine/pyridoxamine 5'-phosphate oxidase n=1 Tax=Sphingomicrobium lutaoense TaxID=515949 RepID=A0A839YZB8_9SPHN|nr:pyridoxamine 5'-phosphate oxidase [Sphingomicrobium lutaoense]MBB3763107.1 pyridoxamine 5'-phosphate oxidase [Sphingomicrobium lutaoense]
MDPLALFDEWYAKAKAGEPSDPDAMALATSDGNGRPSVRMVLLKAHGPEGFVFYTNLLSRKGLELSVNPQAALCFHWKSLYRQVRIEGPVRPVSDEEADAYFASRGRAKQLAASASKQSRPMADRAVFDERIAALDEEYAGRDLPRPPHWSGYAVKPLSIEFWEGTQDRMHHRQLFTRTDEGSWTRTLLYP